MKTPSNPGVTRLDASRLAREQQDAATRRMFDEAELLLARLGLDLDMRGFVAAPSIEPIDDMLKRSKGDRARRHVAIALNELKTARHFLTAPKPKARL